jgi:hypothetical protein
MTVRIPRCTAAALSAVALGLALTGCNGGDGAVTDADPDSVVEPIAPPDEDGVDDPGRQSGTEDENVGTVDGPEGTEETPAS